MGHSVHESNPATDACNCELGPWVMVARGLYHLTYIRHWPLQAYMNTEEFREAGTKKSTYIPSHLQKMRANMNDRRLY